MNQQLSEDAEKLKQLSGRWNNRTIDPHLLTFLQTETKFGDRPYDLSPKKQEIGLIHSAWQVANKDPALIESFQ